MPKRFLFSLHKRLLKLPVSWRAWARTISWCGTPCLCSSFRTCSTVWAEQVVVVSNMSNSRFFILQLVEFVFKTFYFWFEVFFVVSESIKQYLVYLVSVFLLFPQQIKDVIPILSAYPISFVTSLDVFGFIKPFFQGCNFVLDLVGLFKLFLCHDYKLSSNESHTLFSLPQISFPS